MFTRKRTLVLASASVAAIVGVAALIATSSGFANAKPAPEIRTAAIENFPPP